MPRSARSSGLKSSRLGGSLRRDGDVLVINVDDVPSRRRAAVLALGALVAIGALVWVGSVIRGEDVTVMSSSITRSDPFSAETSSTVSPSTTEESTTLPEPIGAADAVGDTTGDGTAETTVPAPETTLPVVAVEPAPTTTVKPPTKKKRATSPTTTAPEPLPPGFNLPAGFYLPPGWVPPTVAPATVPPVVDPTPVTDVTSP